LLRGLATLYAGLLVITVAALSALYLSGKAAETVIAAEKAVLVKEKLAEAAKSARMVNGSLVLDSKVDVIIVEGDGGVKIARDRDRVPLPPSSRVILALGERVGDYSLLAVQAVDTAGPAALASGAAGGSGSSSSSATSIVACSYLDPLIARILRDPVEAERMRGYIPAAFIDFDELLEKLAHIGPSWDPQLYVYYASYTVRINGVPERVTVWKQRNSTVVEPIPGYRMYMSFTLLQGPGVRMKLHILLVNVTSGEVVANTTKVVYDEGIVWTWNMSGRDAYGPYTVRLAVVRDDRSSAYYDPYTRSWSVTSSYTIGLKVVSERPWMRLTAVGASDLGTTVRKRVLELYPSEGMAVIVYFQGGYSTLVSPEGSGRAVVSPRIGYSKPSGVDGLHLNSIRVEGYSVALTLFKKSEVCYGEVAQLSGAEAYGSIEAIDTR